MHMKGSIPGRCSAGRIILQQRFDQYLRSFGLTQLIILHGHVDDIRLITATNATVYEEPHAAWAADFREAIVIRSLPGDFTGLRHTPFTGLALTQIL
jgi:hypothetical protein